MVESGAETLPPGREKRHRGSPALVRRFGCYFTVCRGVRPAHLTRADINVVTRFPASGDGHERAEGEETPSKLPACAAREHLTCARSG